ncbi:MAG: DUF2279 domain-containing protein [Bernardetiaceae bacterium]|nr:DUF2279 domain-containing protein [Bernardetiaceae bacterium]
MRHIFSLCFLILIFGLSPFEDAQAQDFEGNKRFELVEVEGRIDTVDIDLRARRTRRTVLGASAAYVAGMSALYFLWYHDQGLSGFRLYNDNSHWQQMDKFGHGFSAYRISMASNRILNVALKHPQNRSMLIGSAVGFGALFPIEVFDGFSPAYGSSWGDLLANAGGSLFFLSQQYFWREQRIAYKFSFFPSPYASQRPEMLGNNILESFLKDYNAQTYWFSINPNSFMKNKNSFLPDWLNIAFGYSANEMLYGDPRDNRMNGFHSYRQYFFSLDVDFTRIRTHSKVLQNLFFALNAIKFPFPALEWNPREKWTFRPIYF